MEKNHGPIKGSTTKVPDATKPAIERSGATTKVPDASKPATGSHQVGRNGDSKENRGDEKLAHKHVKKAHKHKKPTYSDYFCHKDLADGLKRNQLIQGELRIHPRNIKKAYVTNKDGKSDILIDGVRLRNRSLASDVVVIKLLPYEDWKVREGSLDRIKLSLIYDQITKLMTLPDKGECHQTEGKPQPNEQKCNETQLFEKVTKEKVNNVPKKCPVDNKSDKIETIKIDSQNKNEDISTNSETIIDSRKINKDVSTKDEEIKVDNKIKIDEDVSTKVDEVKVDNQIKIDEDVSAKVDEVKVDNKIKIDEDVLTKDDEVKVDNQIKIDEDVSIKNEKVNVDNKIKIETNISIKTDEVINSRKTDEDIISVEVNVEDISLKDKKGELDNKKNIDESRPSEDTIHKEDENRDTNQQTIIGELSSKVESISIDTKTGETETIELKGGDESIEKLEKKRNKYKKNNKKSDSVNKESNKVGSSGETVNKQPSNVKATTPMNDESSVTNKTNKAQPCLRYSDLGKPCKGRPKHDKDLNKDLNKVFEDLKLTTTPAANDVPSKSASKRPKDSGIHSEPFESRNQNNRNSAESSKPSKKHPHSAQLYDNSPGSKPAERTNRNHRYSDSPKKGRSYRRHRHQDPNFNPITDYYSDEYDVNGVPSQTVNKEPPVKERQFLVSYDELMKGIDHVLDPDCPEDQQFLETCRKMSSASQSLASTALAESMGPRHKELRRSQHHANKGTADTSSIPAVTTTPTGRRNHETRAPRTTTKKMTFIKFKEDPTIRDFIVSRYMAESDVDPTKLNLFRKGVFHSSVRDIMMEGREDTFLLTGEVVSIVEKVHLRSCSGFLDQGELVNDQVRFKPVDNRMPFILLNKDDTITEFMKRPQDYVDTIYIATITSWKSPTHAIGNLVKSIGQAGDIDPETICILHDNDVDDSEFSQEVLDCLPKGRTLSELDPYLSDRLDLREKCIFTVDPMTARDLDDALSCTLNEDGSYEIGVHIADVSHFIECRAPLDELASQRCTSVYLVQKVIPMLPRLLCEELCSLNPGVDRLCFSVIWDIDIEGNITAEKFTKTVIRSCAKLAYEHAQGFIEEPDRKWTLDEMPEISAPFNPDIIRDKVLILDKVAKALKKKRLENGSVRIDNLKIQFSLDEGTGMPNGFKSEQRKDSNKMIEEFMLLANMAVAQRLYKLNGEKAVLRRHPSPKPRLLDELESLFSSYGFKAQSSLELQKSMNEFEIANKSHANIDYLINVMSSFCSRTMQLAEYFCSEGIDNVEDCRHYALAIPLYTHFTSPIRRYADIMVHRVLAATLDYPEEKEYVDAISPSEIRKLCTRCNIKKKSAKIVSDLSLELYLGIFIRDCGPLEEQAIVLSVMNLSFDVILMRFGCTKRIYLKDVDLVKYTFTKQNATPTQTIEWPHSEKDRRVLLKQTVKMFEIIRCMVKTSDKDPVSKFKVILLKPEQ